MAIHQKAESREIHMCPIPKCGKTYYYQSSMRKHVRKQHMEYDQEVIDAYLSRKKVKVTDEHINLLRGLDFLTTPQPKPQTTRLQKDAPADTFKQRPEITLPSFQAP